MIEPLVDEIKEPGTYQAELITNGMREGIYLYQLTAGSVMLTKKMILKK